MGRTLCRKNVFRMSRDPLRERTQSRLASLQPRLHGAAQAWPAAAGRDRWAQAAHAAVHAAPQPDAQRADTDEGLGDVHQGG